MKLRIWAILASLVFILGLWYVRAHRSELLAPRTALPQLSAASHAAPASFSSTPAGARTAGAPASPSVAPVDALMAAAPRGMLVAAPGCPLPRDPTAGMPVVADHEESVARLTNTVRRVRIVEMDFKYPFWRVEELIVREPVTGTATVRGRAVMVADHVLVRLQDGKTADDLRSAARRCGADIRAVLHKPGFYLVQAPEITPDAVPHLLSELQAATDTIRYAEPDHILQAVQTFPNDPQFGALWGLHNTGQTGGTPDADIDAPEAWDIARGGSNVVAAVIDTGVDYTHPDLVDNIWSNPLEIANGIDDDGNGFVDDIHGWDFVRGTNAALDDYGHGTHVAGTIAAAGNNALGVVGVNWRCRIMSLKFLDRYGNGTTSDAVEALAYAAAMYRRGVNVRLTNNSWGGGGETALSDAVLENGDAGILFVAAAGNTGWNNDLYPFYPASYPWSNIIAVAASDATDTRASFSHYGRVTVDLAAPGVSITSTLTNGTYGSLSGTSMATPHVAGVAALLWSTWPDATWQIVRDAILRGTDPIPSMATLTATGGRLNAYKALITLFRLLHTPMENTFNTGVPYNIDAQSGPDCLLATNALQLHWTADGTTNFQTLIMTRVSNALFRAQIPVQAVGTTIYYWIGATPTIGQPATSPVGAPAAYHRFTIVPPQGFIVAGVPDNYGTVSPDYGWYTYPSGRLIRAVAAAHTEPVNAARWDCAGWTGMGSVPASGTSNEVTFALSRASAIEWRWQMTYALTQTDNVAAVINTSSWWAAASTGVTVTAPVFVLRQGTNYAFTGWSLDGSRQPDPTNSAINPVTGIFMNAPHTAQAIYIDASRDVDGDGLPDWWELYRFGSTAAAPGDDPDGDGYSNLDEYRDNTNPGRADSVPVPPTISHTPLADPQITPAPFLVQATVTDNYSVASVVLQWSRSGAALVSTTMSTAGSNVYQACLPAPGTNGDAFIYFITATDNQGGVSTNGPHRFNVDYPFLDLPAASAAAVLLPDTVSSIAFTVGNRGSTNLLLSADLVPAGFSDTMETGAVAWSHGGSNDLWTVSTNRSVSARHAWYCGNASLARYTNSMHAWLDTPSVYLGRQAQLTFSYWMQSELDTQYGRLGWQPMHAWDGGIVEISTNAGRQFEQIAPIGGYPYKIQYWSMAPWSQDTPCFAGTGGWQQVTFDLSAYAQKMAIIRFHFGCDDNAVEEGWYIDDVVLTPDCRTNLAVALAPPALNVPPEQAADITLTFDSHGIPTGNRDAALRLVSNAANVPTGTVPVVFLVRSPPHLAALQAGQTSTNGEGLVTISNLVYDVDGDPCALELSWSPDGGVSWSNVTLLGSSDVTGPLGLASNASSVLDIRTEDHGVDFSNTVAAVWKTVPPGQDISLAPGVRLRGRLWDGLYWSEWALSPAFMVDNEPPEPPSALEATSHTPGVWSTNAVMSLRWLGSKDGSGSGVIDYRFEFVDQPSALMVAGFSSECALESPALTDSSNLWVSVRARDMRGNLSTATVVGPYRIDVTPPSALAARVAVPLSPFGWYLVGAATVTGTWENFTDSGSGIAGYYYALTNLAGTTNGACTDAPTGCFAGLQEGATNTLFVWAEDQVGHIGMAASTSFPVLVASDDSDGDHLSNGQEEVAGTDARDPRSALRLTTVIDPSNQIDRIRLLWQGTTNRTYTLQWREALAPESAWLTFPDFAQRPGLSGTMGYPEPLTNLPLRFYRILVEPPQQESP